MELRKYQNHLQRISWLHFQSEQEIYEQQQSETQGGGLPTMAKVGIILALIALLALLIFLCYKKLKNRSLYQTSPEHFSSRPSLSWLKKWRYKKEIVSLTNPQQHTLKYKETYDGKIVQVQFKSNCNCIYFSNILQKPCYFEIQAVKLSSIVQIGYVHIDDIHLIVQKNKNGDGSDQFFFDQNGVSVRTDGTTYIYGNNQVNFDWRLQYGETLGIGLTEHDSGRRVWIAKNGVVQNPPSFQETLKYIEVDPQTDHQRAMKNKNKNTDQSSESSKEEQREKRDKQANKKKIQMKTSRKFQYYAVIVSENPTTPLRQTVINWNLGGQNFRLYDAQKLGGLLV